MNIPPRNGPFFTRNGLANLGVSRNFRLFRVAIRHPAFDLGEFEGKSTPRISFLSLFSSVAELKNVPTSPNPSSSSSSKFSRWPLLDPPPPLLSPSPLS